MPAQVKQKKLAPLKILLMWEATVRLFKRRNREFFTTIGAIALLLAIILFFLKEWFLIAVIIALLFVGYVLATVPPASIKHKITNRGIVTGGKNYSWSELGRFWLRRTWDQKILEVETGWRFPGRLIILLGGADQKEVKKILSEYLPFEKPAKTWMDKAGSWLVRQVPLEG